jgi:hypothetical protein
VLADVYGRKGLPEKASGEVAKAKELESHVRREPGS